MSRRVEITVPTDWAEFVRECLEDKERCFFNEDSDKPFMIVEVPGVKRTIFFVTIPGPAVSSTLEILRYDFEPLLMLSISVDNPNIWYIMLTRKNGIGVSVGRIALTSLEYIKPDLSKPLEQVEIKAEAVPTATDAKPVTDRKKPPPLKGYQHFQKVSHCRKQ